MTKVDLRNLDQCDRMKKSERMGRKKKPTDAQQTYAETKRAIQAKRTAERMMKH